MKERVDHGCLFVGWMCWARCGCDWNGNRWAEIVFSGSLALLCLSLVTNLRDLSAFQPSPKLVGCHDNGARWRRNQTAALCLRVVWSLFPSLPPSLPNHAVRCFSLSLSPSSPCCPAHLAHTLSLSFSSRCLMPLCRCGYHYSPIGVPILAQAVADSFKKLLGV